MSEFHYQFKLLVNAGDTSGRPDFLPNMIDDYADRAQMKFIKDLTPLTEYNQTVQDKLGTLIISSPEKQPAVSLTSLGNGYYELPFSALTPYRYHRLLKVKVDGSSTNCALSQVTAHYHQKDDDYTAFTEPSATWKRIPYFIGASQSSTGMALFFDTKSRFTLSRAYVSYIRQPEKPYLGNYTKIDGTSSTQEQQLEIHEDYHDEIVRIAAQLALADTSNPQVQITSQLVSQDKTTINP